MGRLELVTRFWCWVRSVEISACPTLLREYSVTGSLLMKGTHQPILPGSEEDSVWRAFFRFLPPALIYSMRHLTLGVVTRLRWRYLKWRGKKYYV